MNVTQQGCHETINGEGEQFNMSCLTQCCFGPQRGCKHLKFTTNTDNTTSDTTSNGPGSQTECHAVQRWKGYSTVSADHQLSINRHMVDVGL